MRRLWLLAGLTAVLAGCGGSSGPPLPPNVIARVGDRPITNAQFDAAFASTRRAYLAQHTTPFPKPGSRDYESLRDTTVRLLVDQARIEVEARRAGIVLTDKELDAKFREYKRSFGRGVYERQLRLTGQTDADVRRALRLGILIERLSGREPTNPKVVYAKGWKPAGE